MTYIAIIMTFIAGYYLGRYDHLKKLKNKAEKVLQPFQKSKTKVMSWKPDEPEEQKIFNRIFKK